MGGADQATTGIVGSEEAAGHGGAEQDEEEEVPSWILRLLPKSSGLCDESRGIIADMGTLRRSRSCSSFGADEFKGFKRTQEETQLEGFLRHDISETECSLSKKARRSNLSVSLDSWSSKCSNIDRDLSSPSSSLAPTKIIAGFDDPESFAAATETPIFHGFDLSAGVLPYSSFQDQIEGGSAKIKAKKKNPTEEKKGLASLLTPILNPPINLHESGTSKIGFIHNQSVLTMQPKISNKWINRWSFPITNPSSSASSASASVDDKPMFFRSSSKSTSINQKTPTGAPNFLGYVPSAAALAIVGKSSMNFHSASPNASWSNSIAAWQSDEMLTRETTANIKCDIF